MKKIFRMTRSRALIIVSVLAIAMSSLFAGPANAAANGQQIGICGPGGSRHVKFAGTNQNLDYVVLYMDFDGWCPVTTGWWWRSHVVITFYDANWNSMQTNGCWVPDNNSEDTYWC